jgi:hypothetical protein
MKPSFEIVPKSLPWRGEKKRGRKGAALTVDTVSHLPTLSLLSREGTWARPAGGHPGEER